MWQKIRTVEDPEWTKLYHDPDPNKRAFGGRIVVKLKSGELIEDQLAVANAHPAGGKPFSRSDYIQKFKMLTDGLENQVESNRFLDLVQNLSTATTADIRELNIVVEPKYLKLGCKDIKGIF